MECDYCTRCGECCKHIAVDFDSKILFFDGIQTLTDEFVQMLIPDKKKENITYCKCKYLKKNLCTNSHKPEICQNYPSSPFAYIPENCGYSGQVFMKLEKEKQKIRKLKEEIIHYEALIKTAYNNSDIKQYEKIINSHKAKINYYGVYGSNDW